MPSPETPVPMTWLQQTPPQLNGPGHCVPWPRAGGGLWLTCGATIINSVFNVTLNLIDHGMSIQQAINVPRLSVTGATGTISCEGIEAFMQPKFSIATQDYLRGIGHLGLEATGTNGCLSTIGSVQGVVMDLRSGRQYGGADPRREGTVIDLKPKKEKGEDDDDRGED